MTQQLPPSFFEKIQQAAKMRPRWVFLLEQAAIGFAVLLVAIGLVYFGSFISFLWRSAQLSALPAFGSVGYGVFARSFPWWQAALVVLGIIAFLYLLRRHTHLYRWPLAVTLGVFFLGFVIAAAVTDSARLHDRLANRALGGHMVPVVGSFYGGHMLRGLVTPGEITKISGHTLTVQTDGEAVRVTVTDDTRLPPGWDPEVGDAIVIIGEREDDTITAAGIRPAEDFPDRRPFRMPHKQPALPSMFFE